MNDKDKRLIQRCIKNKQQIAILRESMDADNLILIPLKMSDHIIAGHYVRDFVLDGYKIISLAEITSIKRGALEEYHDEILRGEYSFGKNNYIEKVNIETWQGFFEDISKFGKMINITQEHLGETFFYVGRVIAVKQEQLEFLEINPEGEWDDETTMIEYEEITMVDFGDRYSSMLHKYSK